MPVKVLVFFAVSLLLICGAAVDMAALAQSNNAPQNTKSENNKALSGQRATQTITQEKPASVGTRVGALQVPEPDVLLMMIRTTLLTLNDGVQTGNFTVLRDIGAPSFQDQNSAFALGEIFADLRSQRVNLAPVSITTPQITEPPTIDGQNLLRFAGYFPTSPLEIHFQLIFQPVQSKWRVLGLSVQTKTTTSQ